MCASSPEIAKFLEELEEHADHVGQFTKVLGVEIKYTKTTSSGVQVDDRLFLQRCACFFYDRGVFHTLALQTNSFCSSQLIIGCC